MYRYSYVLHVSIQFISVPQSHNNLSHNTRQWDILMPPIIWGFLHANELLDQRQKQLLKSHWNTKVTQVEIDNFSIFLLVYPRWKRASLFINPVCNRDIIFLGKIMPFGRQICIMKTRLIRNQSKCGWCHYFIAIVLSNQHLLHNDKL